MVGAGEWARGHSVHTGEEGGVGRWRGWGGEGEGQEGRLGRGEKGNGENTMPTVVVAQGWVGGRGREDGTLTCLEGVSRPAGGG